MDLHGQLIRVALVDDSELTRHGLAGLLAPMDDLMLVGTGDRADLTLFDSAVLLHETGMTDLVAASDGRLVLYCWDFAQHHVDAALRAGASGCLSKALTAEELADSLWRVVAGERVVLGHAPEPTDLRHPGGLTDREADVIALIATGVPNTEIARALHLSINTVKSYIRGAYRKIGVTTRPQAVLWALSNGVLPPVADTRRGSAA